MKKNRVKISSMEGFAERLAFSLDTRNMSQSELSRLVGLSQAEISNFIRKVSYPRLPVAQKMAFKLSVSYSWLGYGVGEMRNFRKVYPLEEFWANFAERMSYLLWTNNLRQVDFARECRDKASSSWFLPNSPRFPTSRTIKWICDRLNCKEVPIPFVMN